MAMAEVVGSMGLTLFCNRCVETFFNFQNGEVSPVQLDNTCKMALNAFSAFCSPETETAETSDQNGIFSTNEAVITFSRALGSEHDQAQDFLNGLIDDLNTVCDNDKEIADRKQKAERLQMFFDSLGDYSYSTSRGCLLKGPAHERV